MPELSKAARIRYWAPPYYYLDPATPSKLYLGSTLIWPRFWENVIPVPNGYVGQTFWAGAYYFGCDIFNSYSDGWMEGIGQGAFSNAIQGGFLDPGIDSTSPCSLTFEASHTGSGEAWIGFGSEAGASVKVPAGSSTRTFSGIISQPTTGSVNQTLLSGSVGATANDKLRFRKVCLVQASSVVPYFNGDSPGAWWYGTPGNSRSARYK